MMMLQFSVVISHTGDHDAYTENYEKAMSITRALWPTLDLKNKNKLGVYIYEADENLT